MTLGSYVSPSVDRSGQLPDMSSLTSDPQLSGDSEYQPREREGFFQRGDGLEAGLMCAGSSQGQAFPEQEAG